MALSGGDAPRLSSIVTVPAFPEVFAEMGYSTALTGLMSMSAQDDPLMILHLSDDIRSNPSTTDVLKHHSLFILDRLVENI